MKLGLMNKIKTIKKMRNCSKELEMSVLKLKIIKTEKLWILEYDSLKYNSAKAFLFYCLFHMAYYKVCSMFAVSSSLEDKCLSYAANLPIIMIFYRLLQNTIT